MNKPVTEHKRERVGVDVQNLGSTFMCFQDYLHSPITQRDHFGYFQTWNKTGVLEYEVKHDSSKEH